MTERAFRDIVASMRRAQTQYFRDRDRETLILCKQLEKIVDAALTTPPNQEKEACPPTATKAPSTL